MPPSHENEAGSTRQVSSPVYSRPPAGGTVTTFTKLNAEFNFNSSLQLGRDSSSTWLAQAATRSRLRPAARAAAASRAMTRRISVAAAMPLAVTVLTATVTNYFTVEPVS